MSPASRVQGTRRPGSRYVALPVPAALAHRVVKLAEMRPFLHRPSVCSPPCAIHSPSAHPLRKAPYYLGSTWMIERSCRHGLHHPDPDSVAFLDPDGLFGLGVHDCDGCCG